jgi:hypothetical protein
MGEIENRPHGPSLMRISDADRQRVADVLRVAIMSDYGQATDRVPAELGLYSAVVRVRGVAPTGSVQVQRLPAPGTPRTYLGTY